MNKDFLIILYLLVLIPKKGQIGLKVTHQSVMLMHTQFGRKQLGKNVDLEKQKRPMSIEFSLI